MNGSVETVVFNAEPDCAIAKRAHYAPPWADVSIIGIAGSSGSGKSTLSHAIVSKLNLPWVVILSMVSSMDPIPCKLAEDLTETCRIPSTRR
jgi:uridine kinase